MSTIPKSVFSFLNDLEKNNNRDWFAEQKPRYQEQEVFLKAFFNEVHAKLSAHDHIEKMKIYRIYKDVRFSINKTPYNIHRSVGFSREGASLRGGYYLRIESGKSMLAGGFFSPNPADLLRIRKEFDLDATEIRAILSEPKFKKAFDGFETSHQVKTAPKGFSKDALNIDLIRKKNFVVSHSFTDQEVLSPGFTDNVIQHFLLLKPFFDYMSAILTTDLNGVSLIA